MWLFNTNQSSAGQTQSFIFQSKWLFLHSVERFQKVSSYRYVFVFMCSTDINVTETVKDSIASLNTSTVQFVALLSTKSIRTKWKQKWNHWLEKNHLISSFLLLQLVWSQLEKESCSLCWWPDGESAHWRSRKWEDEGDHRWILHPHSRMSLTTQHVSSPPEQMHAILPLVSLSVIKDRQDTSDTRSWANDSVVFIFNTTLRHNSWFSSIPVVSVTCTVYLQCIIKSWKLEQRDEARPR